MLYENLISPIVNIKQTSRLALDKIAPVSSNLLELDLARKPQGLRAFFWGIQHAA